MENVNSTITKKDIIYLYENNFELFSYAMSDKIKLSEDDLINIINKYPNFIVYLSKKQQSAKIQNLVIKTNPKLIEYIIKPTDEVQEFIVKNNPEFIDLIHKPNANTMKQLLLKNPNLINKYIKKLDLDDIIEVITERPGILTRIKKEKTIFKYLNMETLKKDPLVYFVYCRTFSKDYSEEFENMIARKYSNITYKLFNSELAYTFKYHSSLKLYIEKNPSEIGKVIGLPKQVGSILATAIEKDPTLFRKIHCFWTDISNKSEIISIQEMAIDNSIFSILYMDYIYDETKDCAKKKIEKMDKQNLSEEEYNQLEIIEKIINN